MIRKILRWIRKPAKSKSFAFGQMGNNVFVADSCEFGAPENIVIEDNVYIGEKTSIFAQGGVTIKEGAVLADHVDIRTANHYYDGEDLHMLPFDEKVLVSPVTIEENVWVASHVLILPGVTVGEGAVIAAGAVVTKNIPPCAVAGGNPARVIKYRDENRYHVLKQQGKQFMKEYETLERKMVPAYKQ